MFQQGCLPSLDDCTNNFAHVEGGWWIVEGLPREVTRIRMIEIHDDRGKHIDATVVCIVLFDS